MTKFSRSLLLSFFFFILSLVVFCPRYYLWDIGGDPDFAENNRVTPELIQIADPQVRLWDGVRYLEWRVLFPVIAHYTQMPLKLFFSLPFLFSLLLVFYTSHLVYRRSSSLVLCITAAALTATSATFFNSTGFLGYFDSALMLCVLTASFSRSNITVFAAAALGPWVDDRFIFALPIIFFCQWCQFTGITGKTSAQPPESSSNTFIKASITNTSRTIGQKTWQKLFSFSKFLKNIHLLPLILGVAPYLFLRIFSTLTNSDDSGSFFATLAQNPHDIDRLILGVWDGLRWGWVFVVLALLCANGSHGLQRVFGITIIPLSFAFLLVCAGDYSRSTATALPLMVLGLINIPLLKKSPFGAIVLLIGALNFFSPAYHSFRAFYMKIYPLPIQTETAKILEKMKEQK